MDDSTAYHVNESSLDVVTQYTDADYEMYVWEVIKPNFVELIFVPIFAMLLLVGLVGNFLVILIVLCDNHMKTVTNMFLLNLAFADFLFLLFCLPFTILWDITKTWWFGTAVCKLILYTQTVSVTVSIITLSTISVERWYAICRPLMFKHSLLRTKLLLAFTWIVGLILSLPELIVLKVKPWPFLRPNFSTIVSIEFVTFSLCNTFKVFH
ncbi:unnamed protein product [Soboliphyme baturini]|uniref:G_PROTEIN_RECEP_F1_2 domain-containing protein n=1 Tax=Soboliphyme baturini TaxID=241478 RepID=A0A183IK14_9BILA|nr:unnamed protein product [Soboliphyme baturini]